MRSIRFRLVTKLFLFCFISLSLIVGLIGYESLRYVQENAVNRYADLMQRNVSMSRDAVDFSLKSIETSAVQLANNTLIKQKITDYAACKHKEQCQALKSNIVNDLDTMTLQNQFFNQITLVSQFNNENQIQSFIDSLNISEVVTDPSVDSTLNDLILSFFTSSSKLDTLHYSPVTLDYIKKMQFSDVKEIWLDSKISPFFSGWDDSIIQKDAHNHVLMQGYVSPSITYVTKMDVNGSKLIEVFETSTHMFKKLFNNDKSSSNEYFIVNSNNQFMYHANDALIGSLASNLIPTDLAGHSGSRMFIGPNQTDQLLSFAKSEIIPGWKVVSIVPVSTIAKVDQNLVLLVITGIMLFVAMVSALIAWFAQRTIAKPLSILSNTIASIEHGATSIERVHINSSDEIGSLGRTMNFVADLLDRLHEQSEIAEAKGYQVQYLLDNSGHGILTFGSNLSIHNEFSFEMEFIYLQTGFIGLDFVDITFPNDRAFLHSIFEEVFGARERRQQDTFLSLLPSEAKLNDRMYHLEYKMILKFNQQACMVIYTDITEKRYLESKLEQESRAMKMIVKAVQNRNDVLNTIQAYKRFSMIEVLMWTDEEKNVIEAHDHLMRQVHTFKGSFAQFHFISIGSFLHEVEGNLAQLAESSYNHWDLNYLLNPQQLIQALVNDEMILKNALGNDFFEMTAASMIENVKIEELRYRVLASTIPEKRELISTLFEEIHYKPIRELLHSYPLFVAELATGLDKFINPLVIEGGHKLVDPKRISQFTNSLVHVFRNILDHGIETIDERLQLGKDEFGNISCSITESEKGINIEISDDGRGIDRNRIVQKAIQKGFCTPEEADVMAIEQVIEFIFADDFSTKDEVSELSGRGIGMAAVKEEVEKIGGTLRVESNINKGTIFLFWIPVLT